MCCISVRMFVCVQFNGSTWLSSDVDELKRTSSVDLNSYLDHMSKTSSYRDGIMLEMAIEKYKRPICIVSKDFIHDNISLSNPEIGMAQCMFLSYTGSNHYDSILPWPTTCIPVPQALTI